MTRETSKQDGKTNKAEEHDFGKSLKRDLPRGRAGRGERAGKTGEAGMERERNSCEKNWKSCMTSCMEHEGYRLTMLRKGQPVVETERRTRNCSARRAEAHNIGTCDCIMPGKGRTPLEARKSPCPVL